MPSTSLETLKMMIHTNANLPMLWFLEKRTKQIFRIASSERIGNRGFLSILESFQPQTKPDHCIVLQFVSPGMQTEVGNQGPSRIDYYVGR